MAKIVKRSEGKAGEKISAGQIWAHQARGELYLLVRIKENTRELGLVNINDGALYSTSSPVEDTRDVSYDEFKKIRFGNDFTLYTGEVTLANED